MLAADAVVCVACGYDRRIGEQRRRSIRRALYLPHVSGRQSFLALLACMAITALLVPMVLKLPAWVEAELVVTLWWAIWCVALTLFLYSGWLVTHDFQKPSVASPNLSHQRDSYSRGWWDGYFWGSFPNIGGGGDDLAGCFLLILLIILMPFILLFLAETALLLAFVLYLLIRGMLAQVVNSRLRCQGRLARSLAFGVLWATVYTAPLAGLVWIIVMASLGMGGSLSQVT
jgi:hypothetical protein